MKVSALIPTYNRRKYVFRAIDSVLAQTVPVDEIIVVDDGSTDGTAEEIERQFGSSIRVVRQANAGVSSARRRAVLEAKGDWIAFLDSDDVWTPLRNRTMLDAIEKAPGDVAWIFGNTQKVTDGGDGITLYEEQGLRIAEPVHVFQDPLSVQFPMQFGLLQGSVIRRRALLEVDCFSENLNYCEDILVGYQIACRYHIAAVPDIVTKLFRTSDLSASSLAYNRVNTPDHYRALMLVFPLLMKKTGKRDPWAQYYAGAVRGLCKLRAAQRQGIRRLVMEQFRYGASFKSVAFFCAAAFGGPGLYLWKQSATMGRAIQEKIKATSNPFRMLLESSIRRFFEPGLGDKRN